MSYTLIVTRRDGEYEYSYDNDTTALAAAESVRNLEENVEVKLYDNDGNEMAQ